MKNVISILGVCVVLSSSAVLADAADSAKTKPATRRAAEPMELKSAGFFKEMAAAAVGHGADDPSRLPKAYRDLWMTAVQAEVDGNLPGTLDALHALNDAFAAAPRGMERLDAITRHEKQKPFAQWMAEAHANVLAANLKSPTFDLRDVRDIEKPALIGIFKERTAAALEPLKTYFPTTDEKTGKIGAFTPDQLAGITVANAIEVKHQALYASAILLGQMNLEPNMPTQDKQLIRTQLMEVRRVLGAASSLEPAAKAAVAQADREKRLTDMHARQEAAKHPAAVPTTNK